MLRISSAGKSVTFAANLNVNEMEPLENAGEVCENEHTNGWQIFEIDRANFPGHGAEGGGVGARARRTSKRRDMIKYIRWIRWRRSMFPPETFCSKIKLKILSYEN